MPVVHTRNLGRKWIVKIPGLGKEMGFVARILTGANYGKLKVPTKTKRGPVPSAVYLARGPKLNKMVLMS